MPRAIALGSMAWQIGAIGGPALAGLLFAAGPRAALLDGSGRCWRSAAALLIRSSAGCRRPRATARRTRSARSSRGFRYVWNERFLLGCITLDLFAVLLGGATALLPVFARDILTFGGEPVGATGLA